MNLFKYKPYFCCLNIYLVITTIILFLISSYAIAKSKEIISNHWGEPKYSDGRFIYPKENLPGGTPPTVRKLDTFKKFFTSPNKLDRITLLLSFGPPDYGYILKPNEEIEIKESSIPLPEGAWEGWIYKLDDNTNQIYVEIAGNVLIYIGVENLQHNESKGEIIWSITQQSKADKKK